MERSINGKYDCEIVGLYVDPQNQGQGIGKLLFKRVREEFIASGKRSLIVWTLDNVAIVKRRLKEGKTYEDFRKAWYHTVGCGTWNKMYSLINV